MAKRKPRKPTAKEIASARRWLKRNETYVRLHALNLFFGIDLMPKAKRERTRP